MNFRIERFNFLRIMTETGNNIIESIFGNSFIEKKPVLSFFINFLFIYSLFLIISSVFSTILNTPYVYYSDIHQYCIDANQITSSISFYNVLGLSSLFCSFCSVKEVVNKYSQTK